MTTTKRIALVACLVAFTWTTAATAASPKTNYMLACQGCHLPDGSGSPGKVPALKGEIAKFLHVDGGRDFLVQVPGTSQSSLTDLETAEVLNWILTTMDPQHLPETFIPYTQDEISLLRGQKLTDVSAVRSRLVAQFPDFPETDEDNR